jgi:hypothetical protein
MRKVSLILAVLLFTVPAWAVVTITCQQIGSTDEVLVSYDASTEPNKVRAFALDITVDAGSIIDVDANIADYDPNYNIYPGSIVIVDGEVNDPGNAVADPCDYPPDTQPGLNSTGITVEMGALYDPPEDANGPPTSGDLLKFRVTATCNVSIAENDARGGVVLTDPNADPCVVAPGCFVQLGCYPDCLPDYSEWLSVNSPDCWCYPRQCHGDSDNIKEYIKGKGYYYVHFKDLGVLLNAWNVTEPPQGPGIAWPNVQICADFAHNKEYIKGKGYYRVHFKDLGILLNNWNVREPPADVGIPPDCLDCP